jgi:hypothetical protein
MGLLEDDSKFEHPIGKRSAIRNSGLIVHLINEE